MRLLALAALAVVGQAATITGGPFGILTNASLTIPTDGQTFAGSQQSTYSQTFEVTVTGGPIGDPGWLRFTAQALALPFWDGPQQADDFSALQGTLRITSVPWDMGGSTPNSCGIVGDPSDTRCWAPIIFGVPQIMTFNALSMVSYSGTISGYEGATIQTSLAVLGVTVRDSALNTLADASAEFDPVPEPSALWLVLLGLLPVYHPCNPNRQKRSKCSTEHIPS